VCERDREKMKGKGEDERRVEGDGDSDVGSIATQKWSFFSPLCSLSLSHSQRILINDNMCPCNLFLLSVRQTISGTQRRIGTLDNV